MKAIVNLTEWAKIGAIFDTCFVGKDAICIAAGCQLLFINLTTGNETLYTANNAQKGDGIKCFVGHRTTNVFAFAENCLNPTIFVKSYPDFAELCTLENGCPEGYKAIGFSETSVMMTLGELPNFLMIAWNWRTGVKLATCNASIQLDEQRLRCNLNKPVYTAQLGIGTNRIGIWETYVCGEKAVLKEDKVHLPKAKYHPFTAIIWTSEGALFVIDSTACVYVIQVANEIVVEKVIEFTEPGTKPTSLAWFNAGLLIAGPNDEIRDQRIRIRNLPTGLVCYDHVIKSNQSSERISDPDSLILAERKQLISTTNTLQREQLWCESNYNTNHSYTHYKKSGTWSVDWTTQSPEPVKRILPSNRPDCVLMLSEKGNIMRYAQHADHTHNYTYLKQYEASFIDFGLIYPTGLHLVVLCNANVLNILEVATGHSCATVILEGNPLVLAANPQFPYVAVGYESGILELISVYKPESPSKMISLYLTKEPINSLHFIENGRVLVAANTDIGRFFILEGLPGSKFHVLSTVLAKRQISDYMLIISADCYRLFTIPVTSDKYIAGNVIVRYCVVKNKCTDVREYQFEDPNALYTKICGTAKPDRDRIFYCIPFDSKSIHEIEIKRGSFTATVARTICTGHQMKQINMTLTKNFCLTWAYDGFVILRNSKFTENIGIVLPHHRMKRGVKKAFVDPFKQKIVSLGYDNVLICTTLTESQADYALKEQIHNLAASSTFDLLFTRRTFGFSAKGALADKCWLEIEEAKRNEEDHIKCLNEMKHILEEFKEIQKQLQQLLTANIEGPDNEKLDMEEFVLDRRLYEEKVDYARRLRKATDTYMRKQIVSYNRVSKWLIETFWDKMNVRGTVIQGIFSDFEVANYVFLQKDFVNQALKDMVDTQRQLEEFLNPKPFKPWEPFEESELKEMMENSPKCAEEKQQLFTANIVEDEEEEEGYEERIEQENERKRQLFETEIAFSGSNTIRYMKHITNELPQVELQAYFQIEQEASLIRNNSLYLKEMFNKEFDATMTGKIREMNSIKEKNTRLRHIVSETNYFSENKIYIDIEDPTWKQEETPELIVKVNDNEVPITPYISPSEQALLDAEAAEAERIRLLLLADDFRERALMAMMNGVLEVRWEDELRKEVPLPKCMLDKEPEAYNEEDLKAVRDYEEKVKFLNSERERYKVLLEAEYGKLATAIREGTSKFNNRLGDLLILKMKIETCIRQDTLKLNKFKLHLRKRILFWAQYHDLKNQIKKEEKVIENIVQLNNSLNEAVVECRQHVETVLAREKVLEKSYKKDFQDASLVIQEQAVKLYRKRPTKINLRNLNSPTILSAVAKCVITKEISPHINQECVEFLKALDQLDQYVGISPLLDETHFALMCRHRRLKIEQEIKTKEAQMEVSEAETSLQVFQKKLQQKKEKTQVMAAELNKLIEDLFRHRQNVQLQIVMPKGLVEVATTGEIKNFDDAILVRRKDVEDINNIILVNGHKKLLAMQTTMTFRRRIIEMEWEHKRLKMQIEDLKEKMQDINGIKVTKDIQAYLKAKARGYKENIIPFTTEVDMIKASYENIIKERKDVWRKIKAQIRVLNEDSANVNKSIADLNLDVCEFKLQKDDNLETKENEVIKFRMKTLLKRSKMVEHIQQNHNEILMLQTELELLRLKTFPTLKYKIFA